MQRCARRHRLQRPRRHVAHDALHRFVGPAFDPRHRLVKQQAPRIVHQRARHADELLLAIGQIADGFLRRIAQADAGERVAGPFLASRLRGCPHLAGRQNISSQPLAG